MIRLTINGAPHELPEGGSILDALRRAGVIVPALCHDDRLAPSGACRSCLVRVSGSPRPVAACATPACDGMDIVSETADLQAMRRSVLEMLAARYPAAVVARFPDKPFHRLLRDVPVGAAAPAASLLQVDRSHPCIQVDMSRCIDCYRCVRICDELQGQGVWHVRRRGLDTRIEPDGPTLLDSSCVACGACVDTCPTGALEDRTALAPGQAQQWTRTVCPYCGVGCELNVGTRDGHIVSVRPVLDSPVSKGHLCVKGRYAFEFVSAGDRVTNPMIREGDRWRPVTWNEARTVVATRLRELIDRHGPDSVAVLGSARATNEDNYVAQKFARVAASTNNVDCCARVCHAPSAVALHRAFGAGLSTSSFDDIEQARTILVCGANPTENHPVVGARIKQAVRRGAHLIVIDPRRIELSEYADCHLAIRPGTNIALLNAMACTIVDEGLCDRTFIDARTDGFDALSRFVGSWPAERAAGICGVDAEAIRTAARLYAATAPAIAFHGLGVTEHVQGTDGVTALINLALLTGNVGRPGAGVNPLRGQNNVQGSAHMGCAPGTLTGAAGFADGARFEQVWGTPLPATHGLHAVAMIDAAADGRLKALWSVGYDVLLTHPNTSAVTAALKALDFVVVQDMFLTETARECASVFLPACSSFEKEGTFMNSERRIQRVRAALRPAGASKPDWQIMCEVARAMGARGFDFKSPETIWDEVRELCEGARGMPYSRLEEGGLQWPCPSTGHPGTSILHQDGFARGDRAVLQPVDYRPTLETTSESYPLMLITGRSLYQFNAGTMTGRAATRELRPQDVLDISPEDAERVGVDEGEPLKVLSRYGSAVLPAHVSATVQPGQVFATFQQPDVRLNNVTGPQRDPVGTPEYKVTAVAVQRVRHDDVTTESVRSRPRPQ